MRSKYKFIVNGKRKFMELADALAYAERVYFRTGNIVSVEKI